MFDLCVCYLLLHNKPSSNPGHKLTQIHDLTVSLGEESRRDLVGLSGLGSVTGWNQDVSWGCGLICRLHWGWVLFQGHLHGHWQDSLS